MLFNIALIIAILCLGIYFEKEGVISRNKNDKNLEKFVIELEQKKSIEKFQKDSLSFDDRIQDLILSELPGSKVIRNVSIYNGRYINEIPMIVLSMKGFFIVESLNYPACKISGKNNEKNWVCTFPDGNKFSLVNPVYKLNSHIWCLKKELKDVHFNPLIVSSENDLYNLHHFYKVPQLIDMINNLSRAEDIYNENYIVQVTEMIEKLNIKME